MNIVSTYIGNLEEVVAKLKMYVRDLNVYTGKHLAGAHKTHLHVHTSSKRSNYYVCGS